MPSKIVLKDSAEVPGMKTRKGKMTAKKAKGIK
jgi:hypothetical protein